MFYILICCSIEGWFIKTFSVFQFGFVVNWGRRFSYIPIFLIYNKLNVYYCTVFEGTIYNFEYQSLLWQSIPTARCADMCIFMPACDFTLLWLVRAVSLAKKSVLMLFCESVLQEKFWIVLLLKDTESTAMKSVHRTEQRFAKIWVKL